MWNGWSRFRIVLFVALVVAIFAVSTFFSIASAKKAGSPSRNAPPRVTPRSSVVVAEAKKATEESELTKSLRKGTYPTQLAGHKGDIRPDRHGPHRNDPAQGIPKHAYSPFDETKNLDHPCPPGGCDFADDQVLIKLSPNARPAAARSSDAPAATGAPRALTADSSLNKALADQGIEGLTPLFPTAKAPKQGEFVMTAQGERVSKPDLTKWHRARLSKKKKVPEVIESLRTQPNVEYVEPDYVRRPVGGPMKPAKAKGFAAPSDVTSSFDDPLFAQQWHLEAANVPAAWQWLADKGFPPGGSRDIVVAVIDTGVDYTHPDLAANMWTNSLEIADNGIDDDGNGFVDDVHGVSVVSNSWSESGDPMDDHGHGTHVAGIIAAQAGNGMGGVGVAHNVQIMAIKAAQYSGVLSTSDIAEAIYYAVAQGADIINMSFGGYARSQVEEDALAVAFGQAVLVAAAGNDGKVNLPCPSGRDMYPAAYNWVLGVMASTPTGNRASFSNSDCTPHDSHEYELMAPGVDVWSTLPNEQYAAWDGTSMAAPLVSGISALLRTKWTDKDVYSSRFIMGQIAANAAPAANALDALTIAPTPELRYLEHWLFDTEVQGAPNDDDGIVDAGETIELAIVIRNHWGKAEPVSVKLEAWAEGAFQADPYITMMVDTVDYGAIGSFNWDDNGLVYDEQGVITGVSNPFRFAVSADCPNDHVIPLRLTMTALNGLDPTDGTTYTFQSRFYLVVQRGRELPRIISEDMTLSKGYFWIVPGETRINQGITVTITEGVQVQWGSPNALDPYSEPTRAYIRVDGNLLIEGTYEEPAELFPTSIDNPYGRSVYINTTATGTFHARYAKVMTPEWQGDSALYYYGPNSIDHCLLYSDREISHTGFSVGGDPGSTTNSIIKYWRGLQEFYPGNADTCLFQMISCEASPNAYHMSYAGDRGVANCVFLQNNSANYTWSLNWQFCGQDCFDSEAEASKGTHHINNAFLSKYWDPDLNHWMRTSFANIGEDKYVGLAYNYWGTTSTTLIDATIIDLNDMFGVGYLTYQPILSVPATSTYPFVVDLVLSTTSGTDVTVVGSETVTFTVTFNRDMDTGLQPSVSFGPDFPVTDYSVHPIDGGWTDPRTWVGSFNINPITGDGYQLIRVAGTRAADDPWLVTGDDAGRFRFEIITSGTEAMNLQATGGEGFVDLMWTQNDFDLLAGFNVYKSTTADGSYSRMSSAILPSGQHTLRDTNVQPGQTYFYKFTVVKTDMTESDFSNVASAAPLDTIPPSINHSPVATATPGLAISLYADVTDNVAVKGVGLHYRPMGGTDYAGKEMIKTTGDRYSATIEGSKAIGPGIEYYITGTDGVSTAYSGTPTKPHKITVDDKPTITAVTPGHGPFSGGTNVTIAGTRFADGCVVAFGGFAASDVTFVSENQLTCKTPEHYPATVDVTVTTPSGSSATLYRGYAYDSSGDTLELPNIGGRSGSHVLAPVSIASVNGLLAARFTVSFDPAVLSATGASIGSIAGNFTLTANTETPGRISIAMSSPVPLNSSGELAVIDFLVTGASASSTALGFQSVNLNDGAIVPNTINGSFTVAPTYQITGKTMYYNVSQPVQGVNLAVSGDESMTRVSDAGGGYSFSQVSAGSYTLTPSKSDGAGDAISAMDASLVLQAVVDLATLSPHQTIAADVDHSGAVSPMDASYILQYAVGLIALPFPGQDRSWFFDPAQRSYANLGSNQASQDFTAILVGDVNGSWSAAAESQAGERRPTPAMAQMDGRTPAQTRSSLSGKARLTVGKAVSQPGGAITVPLNLKIQEGRMFSGTFTLQYDPDKFQAVSVSTAPLAEGAMASSNLGHPGKVRVALAASVGISRSGRLFFVTFKPKQKKSGAPKLRIKKASLNDHRVKVSF